MKLTERQRKILVEIVTRGGGEAIKHGGHYAIGCNEFVADEDVIIRLERKRCVRLDRVGGSTFAVITERGQEEATA